MGDVSFRKFHAPRWGVTDRAAALGAKLRLGLRASDLDRPADLAVQSPYPNPTPITRAGIRALLDDAFYGRKPAC